MKEEIYALDFKPSNNLATNYLVYAYVYKEAVQNLLDNMKDKPSPHAYAVSPTIYLFRHYIELKLTGLILYCYPLYSSPLEKKFTKTEADFLKDVRKNHSLQKLFEYLKKIDMPKDCQIQKLNPIITKLNGLDKKSDRFRYPENSSGQIFYENDAPFKENEMFYRKLMLSTTLISIIEETCSILDNVEFYLDFQMENYNNYIEHLNF